MRRIILAASFSLTALAFPALAGDAPPDAAFTTAAKDCVKIALGKLSLNPPNPAQEASGIVLADPVGDELQPFKDLSATARIFGAVPSAGPAVVAVASDPSSRQCRVVVWSASPDQLSDIKAALGRMTPYWKTEAPTPGATHYTSEDGLSVQVRQPKRGTGYGKAQLMVSFIKPVA